MGAVQFLSFFVPLCFVLFCFSFLLVFSLVLSRSFSCSFSCLLSFSLLFSFSFRFPFHFLFSLSSVLFSPSFSLCSLSFFPFSCYVLSRFPLRPFGLPTRFFPFLLSFVCLFPLFLFFFWVPFFFPLLLAIIFSLFPLSVSFPFSLFPCFTPCVFRGFISCLDYHRMIIDIGFRCRFAYRVFIMQLSLSFCVLRSYPVLTCHLHVYIWF